MILRGKRILMLESDYMVAHAIQRVLENEGATVHVGPCIGAMVFDGAIVDWGWARRPLVKTLSEAGVPLLAYTSDHVTILRRFPGCQVLSKPASDEGLVHAVIDLLPALRTDAAGNAAFAATILGLIGIIVATLVDDQGSPGDVGKLEVRGVHGLVDASGRRRESWQITLVPTAFGAFVGLDPIGIVVFTGRNSGRHLAILQGRTAVQVSWTRDV